MMVLLVQERKKYNRSCAGNRAPFRNYIPEHTPNTLGNSDLIPICQIVEQLRRKDREGTIEVLNIFPTL